MKILLLVLLFGFAAASVIPGERASAIDEDALAYAEAKQMKTKLGEFFDNILKNFVKDVKDNVQKVKDISKKVTDKVDELKQNLKKLGEGASNKSVEALERVKTAVINIVKVIEKNVKNQTANLDEQLDVASKLKFKDLLEKAKEGITERVNRIRQLLKNSINESEANVSKALKEILDKINDSELADLMKNFLDLGGHEVRHLQDLYEKLKALSARTGGALKERLDDLVEYFRTLVKESADAMKEDIKSVRAKLLDLIGTTKDLTAEAAKDALKHLEAYKEQLGGLYGKLVDALKKAIGRF